MPRVSTKLPLILLPPSEGKAVGGDGPRWSPGTMAIDLDTQRLAVLAALATAMAASEASRRKLLGVTGSNLARATEANRTAARGNTMPAIERYTGVLYDALDHASLSTTQRRRLNASVVIFSGLWGLVMPADPVPDYRLKMGASLAPMGTLSTWWREALTRRLLRLAGTRAIWNLLPNEHASAWAPPREFAQWTVRFLDRKSDGSLSAVSHDNKSLKGALVRHLVEHPDTTPADLRTWKHPAGYRYAPRAAEHRGGVTIVSMICDRSAT
jgi:cytoplasmic iron level regulating protein YaaA (DUF328/UPF0246 family)